MVHKKKNNPYFKDRIMGLHVPTLPEESEGSCKRCKKFSTLGDGYCDRCWDRKTGAARTYVEAESE